MDDYVVLYIIPIAILHVIGEIIYKKGSEEFFHQLDSVDTTGLIEKLTAGIKFFLKRKIFFSIVISLTAKLLFAVMLQFTLLSTTPAIYLALVIIFSQIGGMMTFSEKINGIQVLGVLIILIGVGILGGKL
jgi:drug/metabolite transporter (DMT)-like permease